MKVFVFHVIIRPDINYINGTKLCEYEAPPLMLPLIIGFFALSYVTNEWNLLSQPSYFLMHKIFNAIKGFPQCAYIHVC